MVISLASGIPVRPPTHLLENNTSRSPEKDERLQRTAKEFEATFIAQMLSYSGLSKALSANGGFGGEAFSTLLVEKYAAQLSDQGGFGLAQTIYEQLRDKESVNDDKTPA